MFGLNLKNNGLAGLAFGIALSVLGNLSVQAQTATDDPAWAAYQTRNYQEALRIWQSRANDGDSNAAYNLGVMFAEGRGTHVDINTARKYWETAAEEFHPWALHALGLLYLAGDGVETDHDKALELFRQAANLGSMRGQYAYSKMLLEEDDEEDVELAFALMLRAAKSGFARAQHNVGKLYRDGLGTEPDLVAAIAWFKIAADQGYAPSQRNLASRLQSGDGIALDKVSALKWAILAARHGLELAESIEADLRVELNAEEIAKAEADVDAFIPMLWRAEPDNDS